MERTTAWKRARGRSTGARVLGAPASSRTRAGDGRDGAVGHAGDELQRSRHGSASQAVRSRSRRCHARSEEHTSELQSQSNLVCRLLLEKKKKIDPKNTHRHLI